MISKLTLLFLGAAAFATAQSAKDGQGKPQPKAVPGETVTITAEADSVEVAKTPNQVIVVDAEKIAKAGTSNLVRLLEYVFPGRAVPTGGPGTQASIFINGARSQDTVVLLDGIRVTDPNLGLNMSNFGLTGVDRVEILLGPASTLYGSDAHGGVVSLSGGAPSVDGLSGHALGQAGTLGQMRVGALVSYSWGSGWVQGSGDADQSPSSIKTDLPYRQSAGHLGFGQQFGESWLLKLNHRSNYIGAPTPFDTDTGWPSKRLFDLGREALVWQSFTTASLKGNFTDSISAEVNLGSISQENYDNANVKNTNTYSSPSHPKLDRTQGNARATWKTDMASVTLLGDYTTEELNTNTANSAVNVLRSATHTAFALEGSIEPLSVLRFVGSMRQQNDVLSPTENSESKVDQMTWKVGANLLLPSGFRAYASTGTSFNTPSLSQVNANITSGKPDLKNERSRSVFAGVGYEHNKQWWLRADASKIDYSDILQYVWDGSLWYYNIQKAQVQGVEVAGGMRGNNWDSELWVRSQEGRQMDLPEPQQLSWFQRRPFFSAGIRANCTVWDVNLGANLSYIGNRYDYPIDASSPTANKTTFIDLTLRGSTQFGKSITVTLLAERLLNDGLSQEEWLAAKDRGQNNVSYAEGFPVQGRSISLELRYKF